MNTSNIDCSIDFLIPLYFVLFYVSDFICLGPKTFIMFQLHKAPCSFVLKCKILGLSVLFILF